MLEAAIGRSMDAHDFTRLVGWHSQPGARPPGAAIYSEVRQPPAYYWLSAAAWRVAGALGLHAGPYSYPDTALRLMRLVSSSSAWRE